MDLLSSDELKYVDYHYALHDYTNRLWSILNTKSETDADRFISDFLEKWIEIEKYHPICNELYSQVDGRMDPVSSDVAPRRDGTVIGENAHDVLHKVLCDVYTELVDFRKPTQEDLNNPDFLSRARRRLFRLSAPKDPVRDNLLNRFSLENRRLRHYCEESLHNKFDDAKQIEPEGSIDPSVKPGSQKKNVGRPACSTDEQRIDRELLREWDSDHYKDYEQLGNKFHIQMSKAEVEKRIRRERQRIKRARD